MLKRFIFLNLFFALVLLPVAQAFANPLKLNLPMDSDQDMTQLCQQMNDSSCVENVDCLTAGMHCVDYNSTGILLSDDLSFDHAGSASLVKTSNPYFYLPHRSILRPPRLI